MQIALAQLNPTVGDLQANAHALRRAYEDAVVAGADLVLGGELGLTGYPPEDLVLKPAFVTAVQRRLAELAACTAEVPLVVGFVDDLSDEDTVDRDTVMSEAETVRTLANAAAVLRGGIVEAVYRKQRIPNYGVFDEARYFQAGTAPLIIDAAGTAVGVTICEDLWGQGGPIPVAARAGAQVLLSLNASPYQHGKRNDRERWAVHHATTEEVWLVYCNLVGGQDEVVFDGDSFVMRPDGSVTARAAQFATDLLLAEVGDAAEADQRQPLARPAAEPDQRQPLARPAAEPDQRQPLPTDAAAYEALVLGVRDYLGKNGFERALVGVSGGIDSALTAAVAVDALGPTNVTCVAMPSPHSSPGSLVDAEVLAANLGARYHVVAITPMITAFHAGLADLFAGTEENVAEENIQSRVRGAILMALSNKFGDLVLATGNKSEYAVGYATLYGDMAGGLAVLKDIDKTSVYALSEYRNATHRLDWAGPAGVVIPRSTIDKPPSAELRPNQIDTDSLPPYEVLDPILAGYVEQAMSVEDLIKAGHDAATVEHVARLVDGAEHKRRQAAPGIKVTPRAFGRDRRLPITQRWWG